MAEYSQPLDRNAFQIAIICALPVESDAVEAFFDEFWEEDNTYGKAAGDSTAYTTGRIGRHNVVLAYKRIRQDKCSSEEFGKRL
jgi:hypothetical protein